MDWISILRANPVIAAFRSTEGIRIRDLNSIGVVFILGGTIFDLPGLVKETKESGKLLFVDIDLSRVSEKMPRESGSSQRKAMWTGSSLRGATS